MVWKIFSLAQQKVRLYTVSIDEHLTIFIDDRSTMETLTIDETQPEEIKGSLREMMELDINQFKEIIKHLNPYFHNYARNLLDERMKKYQGIIGREQRNLKDLEEKEGQNAKRQRNMAYILIDEAQKKLESLL